MDLEYELLKEHSKTQALRIAGYIGDSPGRFGELLQLFLHGSYRATQRAAWVLGICAAQSPYLVEPHLESIVRNLENPVHDAVKRNTVRLLQDIHIPAELEGRVADLCFRFLASGSEPVAVKVFAMSILGNLCRKEPGLANELKLLIEGGLHTGSPAFRSRAVKVLKAIRTLPQQ